MVCYHKEAFGLGVFVAFVIFVMIVLFFGGMIIFLLVFAVANNWLLNFSGFVGWVSGKISWTSTTVYDPTDLGQKSYLLDTLHAFSAALSIPVILLGALGYPQITQTSPSNCGTQTWRT